MDFNEKNLTNQYLRFADTEGKIDDTLNYAAVRKGDFKKDPQNLFHIAVSVQLSASSPIVPFAATYSGQQEAADTCRSNLQKMLQKKEIKYTAVDMIRDLEALSGRKNVRAYLRTEWTNGGKLVISRIQFDGPNFMSDTHWFKDNNVPIEKGGDEIFENENAENLIREIQQQSNGVLLTDETSFVYAMANEYKAITGNKTLYFTITCLDRNLDNKSWQTILTTIGTDSKEFEEFFLQRIIEIREIANCLRTRYIDDLMKKNKLETEKSAKAAIMARNMSHNIGSHVMSYLKQNLGSVQEMLRTGVLSELVKEGALSQNNEGKTILKKGDKDEVVENIALPFLMGMGHFISYLQERQDFIATIATDHIPYYSTLNFKDDIYDVLNPDKRVERHADRSSSMATDNILLGNIARSEDLGRHITSSTKEKPLGDIVLKFRTSFDGNKPDSGSVAETELDEMRNYNVSLPGGILGRQAVFSIFENIIRNAAKHSINRDNSDLEFTIDLFTKEEIKNKIDEATLDRRLPDDDNEEGCLSMRQVLEKFYLSASDSDDHYFLTITDNHDTTLEKLGKLRCALQDDFVETQGSKGLKEMRISAAWIRSIRNESDCFCPKPEVIKDELKKVSNWEKDGEWNSNPVMPAPLVYARLHGVRSELEQDQIIEKNLQYIFCIPIPRIVAVVSNKLTKKTDAKVKSMLADLNWRVFSYEEFEKEWNKTFDFILCEDDLYHDVRQIASARTFSFSQAKIDGDKLIEAIKNSKIDKNGANEYEKGLYQLLAKEEPKDIISIDDKDCPREAEKREGYYYDERIHIADGKFDSAYVYRRHHESEKEFHDFMNDKEKKTPVFVEGISGGNSTDRLVRHGEWDDIWYYRHIHAMKQQVAVIDERLFPKITGREAAVFNDKEEVDADGYKALTYLQKGVYPFTLVSGEDKYYLIGCVCTKDSNGRLIPVTNNKFECLCTKKLAEITYNGNELKITESYLDNHFDYITIHQGLLDKMYEFFGIRDNPSAKIDITTRIFQKWSNQKEGKPYEGGFHPGLVIHSGRSKPTYNDMPQQLPFIQYAALEHAVADCKFTLVELLDFARYSLYL